MKGILGLFPGQGSQAVGMGKDLCENFKIAREAFEEASDASHLNLKKLCFDGPGSDLALTENTQPCLLTTSVAAYRVAQLELGLKLGAVAGHSLGEYSALVASGALKLSTAAMLVHERGKAMQKAVPAGQGGMAAVMGMDEATIEKLCALATERAIEARCRGEHDEMTVEAIVQPANFNAPGQIVIAGSQDGIDQAVAIVKAGEISGKIIPLQVSAPFHCKLMKPARDRMAELFSLASSAPLTLSAPYVPNRTARLTSEGGVIYELLVDQVDHPVMWKQSMSALAEDGFTHAIEFGSGKVLAGLMKRITEPLGKPVAVHLLTDTASLKTAQDFILGATS